VPKGVTAIEDVEVKRLSDMDSRKYFNSNKIKSNSIKLEVAESTSIVLPIPETSFFYHTFVEINIAIINSTLTPFRLNENDTLIPEVLTSDGQAVQGVIDTHESVYIQNNIPYPPVNLCEVIFAK
jgi:hypothetical protein